MEELKRQVAKENEQLEKRKKAIDVELSEIEPLVQVKRGVFDIYNQLLTKIVTLFFGDMSLLLLRPLRALSSM